jgi:hypothetical protein
MVDSSSCSWLTSCATRLRLTSAGSATGRGCHSPAIGLWSGVTERLDETLNMAIFCDFENVAIGAADAKLRRASTSASCSSGLLDKGKIVVKKAYADWDRYKQRSA